MRWLLLEAAAYIYLANSGRPRLFPWQQGGIAPAKGGGIRVLSDNSSRQAVGGCISAPRALPYILIAANPPETHAASHFLPKLLPRSLFSFNIPPAASLFIYLSPATACRNYYIIHCAGERERMHLCARVCICSIDRAARCLLFDCPAAF